MYLKIVLILLAVDPNAFEIFTLVKSAISHVISIVLVTVLAIVVLRGFVGRSWWSPMHAAIASLLVALVLATVFSLNLTVAVFGAWRRYLGLFQMLDFAVVYLAAALLIRTPSDLRRVFVAGAASAGLVIAYALVQASGRDLIGFAAAPGVHPISTLGQQDTLGGFAAIVVATVSAVLVFQWARIARAGRALLLVVLVGALAVLALVAVRNAILGLLAGWGAIALVAMAGHASRKVRYAIGIVGLAAALVFAASPLGQRLRPEALATDTSAQIRAELWGAAWRIVVSRPLLGVGPDNFVVAYPAARSERSEILAPGEVESSAHSWIFYYATSAGLIGFVALVGAVALAVRASVRLAQERQMAAIALVPLAAYLGQGLVDINDLVVDWVFWLSLGVVAGASRRIFPRLRMPHVSPTLPYVVGFVGLALAVIVSVNERSRIAASESYATSRALLTHGRALEAVQYARTALSLDGHRGEYWRGFGTSLSAVGNPSAAANAFLDAARLEPWDPTYWRSAALEMFAAGDFGGAERLLLRALEADSYDVPSLNLLARLAVNRGDVAQAVYFGDRAIRLTPDDPGVYEAPAQAYIRMARWVEAEKILNEAVARTRNAHLHVLLARVYLETGRQSAGVAEVDLALTIDPSSTEAQQLRASLQR